MSKLSKKLSQIIFKQFNFIWILLTVLLLSYALYINWTLSINRSHEDISEVATNVSNKVDGFIEDLFQEIYTLPVYGKSFADCKSGLLPYLQRITLNNQNIAGLSISDNSQQLICSTLPNNETIILSTRNARSLSGPFNLSMFDQPVYLVQQKMGNYHIGILVVASVLQNILKTSDKSTSSIALYNSYEKRNILRIEKPVGNGKWMLSKSPDAMTPLNSQYIFATEKLQSITGITVVVFENNTTLLYNLWHSEIIITFIFLLIFCLMYFLVRNHITKRYSLLGAMKTAIKNEEFYPEYQPLFNCESNTFTGVEVLVRWRDSEDQVIMPDFFIPEAETSGLIIPITLQIIEISLRETQDILKSNTNFHLAYNLSTFHFTDPIFFTTFNKLAEEFSISPHQIIFEITERELFDKKDQIFIGTMQKLRQSGYSLAIDDYGTGHASISYLQHFPFNYLKIDKLFVQAIGTKAITESLNDAIIQMAKGLNLIIIAEGVETEEQVNYLSKNGVRLLQGWYFSKAIPIEKLLTFLKGEKE